MVIYPPKGLIGALVTPLDSDHNIDKLSLRTLLEHTIGAVHGVLIGVGDIGEGFFLNNKQRMELITAGMEAVNGRVPLFLSVTGDTEDQTAENIVHVERTKGERNYRGDIFLLDSPLWYHSNKGLPYLYAEFGKLTNLPFVLHNNPGPIVELHRHLKRKNIRTNVLKKLCSNEQIVGITHVGELRRAINYARAVRDRRDFRVYDGNEVSFLDKPSSGGVVARGANLLPWGWKEITESSINPEERLREDTAYYGRLWNVGQILKSLEEAYAPNPTAIIKLALRLMGKIESSTVAENTPPITPNQESKIYHFLVEHKLIISPS
ncbi:MAG: dihydrodipicolinate synthase family protein [Pseudomonadota bacterium]